MREKKKIALLYFSRNARLEGRKKAWFSAGSKGKNQELAASLIHHTSNMLQQSGLPVLHYHEGNQQGDSFGERIANAYQEIFDLGYEAVIAVGNDTPELAGIDWDSIIAQLESGRCVLGPTFRRGAYLIGLTAEVFQKETFQFLPWQSGRLWSALVQFCQLEDEHSTLLTPLQDINSYRDLNRLIKSVSLDIFLKRLFLSLVKDQQKIVADQIAFVCRLPVLGSALFRAPPVSTFLYNGR